jgi:hypothetical protein
MVTPPPYGKIRVRLGGRNNPDVALHVDPQPSTPAASLGARDTTEKYSAESQDIVVEGPLLPLVPGITILNYH